MDSVIQFLNDFFIICLPESFFLFMFLILTTSKEKDCLSNIISYSLLLNIAYYIIIILINTIDIIEISLMLTSAIILTKAYNKDVKIVKIILFSMLAFITAFLSQLIVIIPMSLVLNVTTAEITSSTSMCLLFQSILRPIQALMIYKLYLIKGVNEHDSKNF